MKYSAAATAPTSSSRSISGGIVGSAGAVSVGVGLGAGLALVDATTVGVGLGASADPHAPSAAAIVPTSIRAAARRPASALALAATPRIMPGTLPAHTCRAGGVRAKLWTTAGQRTARGPRPEPIDGHHSRSSPIIVDQPSAPPYRTGIPGRPTSNQKVMSPTS